MRFRFSGAAGLILALLSGCHRQSTGRADHASPMHEVEEAAYQLTSEGRLRVREDLLKLLKFGPVRYEGVVASLGGFGKIEFAAGASYAIQVPFDGIIETVEVQRGESVVPGQLLAKLRSRDLAKLRADLPRLTATLSAEEDSLKRLSLLQQQGAASEREVIEANARVKALQAEAEGTRIGLTAAKADLQGGDLYLIKAGRPGQVLERNIEPGELIQAANQKSEFVIGDPTQLAVVAHFPEQDAPLLREGQRVAVRVTALRDEELAGRVTAVVRALDRSSRTARVACRLDSPDDRLQAEMSVRVQVNVEGDPRLVVPQSALLLRRDARVVLVRRGEELERRTVKVGLRIGEWIQVIDGVAEGEEVVTENAVLLDGELDRVVVDH